VIIASAAAPRLSASVSPLIELNSPTDKFASVFTVASFPAVWNRPIYFA